jgi:hypothetical protein
MEHLPDWRLHDLAVLTGTPIAKPEAKSEPKKETAVRKSTKERAIKEEK